MATIAAAPIDLIATVPARSAGPGHRRTRAPHHQHRIASIGWQVEVSGHSTGSVHSVFSRAVNCLVDGQLWTVLCPESAHAPFGLRLDGAVLPGDLGARSGDPVRARSGF